MAISYTCDRCHEPLDFYVARLRIDSIRGGEHPYPAIHLCQACRVKVIHAALGWMDVVERVDPGMVDIPEPIRLRR